jgi:hypothetical protein
VVRDTVVWCAVHCYAMLRGTALYSTELYRALLYVDGFYVRCLTGALLEAWYCCVVCSILCVALGVTL